MNKAIQLKTQWDGMKDFGWWEFQMAFILQCIRGVAQDDITERDLCDILWFPTGGGKTEAYLGLTVFSIIYRRLQDYKNFSTSGGVTVISRYTLRLLTLQQFQRSVGAIVASDFLRINKWIPKKSKEFSDKIQNKIKDGTLWGTRRISIGLFIGGAATPNYFKDYRYSLQAEGMLRGKSSNDESSGEPAQILNCPCCKSILAVPTSEKIGLDEKSNIMRWIFSSTADIEKMNKTPSKEFSGGDFEAKEVRIRKIGNAQGARNSKYFEIKIIFEKRREKALVNAEKVRSWWNHHVSKALSSESGYDAKLASTEPAKPGYFFIKENGKRGDFGVYCPNSDCELNLESRWFEGEDGPTPPVAEPFKIQDNEFSSVFMPISAYTIDEQIYRRCPTMIISTVDKFAMMPYMENFASIFGNVDEFHPVKGYGRSRITDYGLEEPEKTIPTKPFLPPSLIIQDELHLIEGPLGSMVGAYELAIDILSSTKEFKPKYIASSATIKESKNQVGAIFRKNASIFPPQGITIEDNYFSESKEDRKSKSDRSGRVYMGICAPQKILTLPVRIWATLLSEVYKIRKTPEVYGLDTKFIEYSKENPGKTFEEFIEEQTDGYWTLIGYFNAIKDLQILRSLYDDDIRRDVKKASQQSESSIEYQTSPIKITPSLRFFPIMSEKDMDITGITIYCNVVLGNSPDAL